MIGLRRQDGGLGKRRDRVLVITVVLVAAAAFGCGGTAWASWTASGTGQGSAGTAFAAPLTLAPGGVARGLYPGGVGDVSVDASNSMTTPVTITALSLDTSQGTGGFAVDPGHQGCGLDALSMTTQTDGGNGWVVPRRTGAVDGTLAIAVTGALHMAVDAADACQGADITVFLTAGS